MWAAYQNIPGLPQAYQHFTVNHSQNFVDPVSNACTNHVEVSYLLQVLHKSYKNLKDKGHNPEHAFLHFSATGKTPNPR